ncbi:MAG: 30S ribosomal protein S8e [Candidatus Thermoplasmatota archaeon]|jgi:small subunit ribosomal protein S8e|nr:30S ribosomal protein S8e [Candidatus Thermoplasmatota archaeon]MCL5785751.1 30S ribosomal protein S8e [Candidatus Thermoplasmatota archaeon]
MTIFQGKASKKFTGGKRRAARLKKRHELGREPTLTKIGEASRKTLRGMGGSQKTVVLREEKLNVYIPKDKKTVVAKIVTVKENPANPHYVQRNIMTKGTVVQTELGMARITSRPGQDGTINAVLL